MNDEKVTVEDLDALILKIKEVRDEIDKRQAALTEKNKELMTLEGRCVDYLKELDRKSYSSPIGTFSIVSSWRVPTPKEDSDKEAFFNYLKEKGIFLQMASVHSQTLNSFYKKELEAAQEKGDVGFNIPGIGPPTLYETVRLKPKN